MTYKKKIQLHKIEGFVLIIYITILLFEILQIQNLLFVLLAHHGNLQSIYLISK